MDPVSSPVTGNDRVLAAMRKYPNGASTEVIANEAGLAKELVHKILVGFRKSGKAGCAKDLGWYLYVSGL